MIQWSNENAERTNIEITDESNSGRSSCEKSAEEKSDDIKKVLSADDQMTNMGNVSKDVTNAVGTMKYVGQCHDLTLLMFLPLAERCPDIQCTGCGGYEDFDYWGDYEEIPGRA